MCGCGEKTPIAQATNKTLGIVIGEPRRFVHSHGRRYQSLLDEKNGRICKACGDRKPLEEFPAGKKYRRAVCKICWPMFRRAYFLQKTYGISLEEYDALLQSQGGGCAICERTTEIRLKGRADVRKSLAVDHDHDTGLIRGILCEDCNRAIGLLQNRADLCRRGSEYLIHSYFNNYDLGLITSPVLFGNPAYKG